LITYIKYIKYIIPNKGLSDFTGVEVVKLEHYLYVRYIKYISLN